MTQKRDIDRYPHLMPEIENWPIYKLHRDRATFVNQIDEFTSHRLRVKHKDQLGQIIARTSYLERIRIKEEPWKVDPPDERMFWRKIRSRLIGESLDRSPEEAEAINQEILEKIVHRYSEEIVGTFRKKTFLFARKFLTVFFSRLLNAAASRNFRRIYNSRYRLSDRLVAKGDIEMIRELSTRGTVVIVPTHLSNLDSILIGFVVDTVLGLPSLFYGAGLNLYNTGYTAYFMNRLGAYRVDRRKKNAIYLETLKSMSNLALQRGTHSLFFPGGTRSRSGALESKLKMGLLGTTVEAQRCIYQEGREDKIFIVPLVLCYNVVLEAKELIEQHLTRTGKELYIPNKKGFSLRKILRFAWKIFSKSSVITLSFGKPLDVLGNFVDRNGNSFDRFGNPVEVSDYFRTEDGITTDLQREEEYTKILANRIVERYHKENIVMSSHLVAYVAFQLLQRQNPSLDLYGVLRLPPEDHVFDQDKVLKGIRDVQDLLQTYREKGRVLLSSTILETPEKILRNGLNNLGVFHPNKPLRINKKGELVSDDFKILYYYHNRLSNYGLEAAFLPPVSQTKKPIRVEP
jgi:glycerol-3-phosphate O-acyltransferase